MRKQAPGASPRLADPSRPAAALQVPPGGWRETALAVAGASLVLWVMVQPAFQAYFFGENFLYLGQYVAHGHDFWRAAFSPINGIFFRPLSFAVSLPWYFVLPPVPWLYHLVNFMVTIITLVLLHRVLLRLVASRAARLLALGFFAVSKIHLTTIGYVNLLESPVTLLLLLATVLCFLQYVADRQARDYAAGLVCCGLSMLVKDYGVVIVGVVVALLAFIAMQPADWRRCWRYWGRRVAPLAPMLLAYLLLRLAVVGPLPGGGQAYAPQVAPGLVVEKALILLMTLPNVSLVDNGTTGAGGLGAVLGPSIAVAGRRAWVLDGVWWLAFLALVALTGVRARGIGWRWAFPVVWILAYWGPSLVVRNVQMYYTYEAAAGAAILLGMGLDGVGLRLRRAWLVALVVIAANGVVSNYRSYYNWQQAASAAQRVSQAVIEAYGGQPLDAITFVTASPAFWQFALTADGRGPMLPVLLGRPALQVRVVDEAAVTMEAAQADSTHVVIDVDRGVVPVAP